MKAFIRCSLLAALLALAWPGFAQSAYPNRPIRIVVPFAAGGAVDAVARSVREWLGALGAVIASSTPEEFARFLHAEIERWATVIKPRNRSWTRPSVPPWPGLARRDDAAG